ncbi:MAG TPA: hypothetical protein VET48_12080, partial [Steroidobacteraceae bacterium]|nr:hypothetical protein [Steroidobacteraceae bacterium]
KFAVDVLRADDRTKYERDYVDFAPSPVAPLKLKRRVIELYDADGHLASAKELNEWFDALAAASTPDRQTIVLPHHLSLAVPE